MYTEEEINHIEKQSQIKNENLINYEEHISKSILYRKNY